MVEQYIGVRFDATGISGYSFRKAGKEVFCCDCFVVPKPDIYLRFMGKVYCHKNYDAAITLMPGVQRKIMDETGETRGLYEYVETNVFNICAGKTKLNVHVVENGWSIWAEDACLAAEIIRLPESERNRFMKNGYDMETRFICNVFEVLNPSVYPYIMAIPMLGF